MTTAIVKWEQREEPEREQPGFFEVTPEGVARWVWVN